jgi:hypothetical protein
VNDGVEHGLADYSRLWLSIDHTATNSGAGLILLSRSCPIYQILSKWAGSVPRICRFQSKSVHWADSEGILKHANYIYFAIETGPSPCQKLGRGLLTNRICSLGQTWLPVARLTRIWKFLTCKYCLATKGHAGSTECPGSLVFVKFLWMSMVSCSSNDCSPKIDVPIFSLTSVYQAWEGFR